MKILECPQGSEEWVSARLGIPTCSAFDRIITPKTLKPSSQAKGYMYQLLAEWLIGVPLESGSTAYMARGLELEEKGLQWYGVMNDVEPKRVGFVLRDDEQVGGSPDALIGDEGGVDVKCLSLTNHVGALLGDADSYAAQMQGYMWITDRSWWDVCFYHPSIPSVVVRHERNQEFAEKLSCAIEIFLEGLMRSRERLISIGCVPAEKFTRA